MSSFPWPLLTMAILVIASPQQAQGQNRNPHPTGNRETAQSTTLADSTELLEALVRRQGFTCWSSQALVQRPIGKDGKPAASRSPGEYPPEKP